MLVLTYHIIICYNPYNKGKVQYNVSYFSPFCCFVVVVFVVCTCMGSSPYLQSWLSTRLMIGMGQFTESL